MLPNPRYFIPAVILMAVLIASLAASLARGEDPDYSDVQIVEAIYRAEGGTKAQYLYGIRSVRYDTPAEARRICFNSVKNGRKRWLKAGRPYDLITFIGLRYCPPKAHPKNSVWVKNVKHFLAKSKKQ